MRSETMRWRKRKTSAIKTSLKFNEEEIVLKPANTSVCTKMEAKDSIKNRVTGKRRKEDHISQEVVAFIRKNISLPATQVEKKNCRSINT